MGLLDDMVTWGRRNADPFNRLSCCNEPVLLVVEFCQVQGPRPLYCVPEFPGSHLDLDSVAMWLMSSEAVHGSTLILYNQQMALYACVHYSSFLDIRARAFQRPVSLALLTANKPTSGMLEHFMDVSKKLFSPLLSCNRQLFKYYKPISPARLSKIVCLATQVV
uniref:UDENN FLCN/SMCR8-type domain-containing protein n=1 Tax=Syphacia muris TaxID=451379 RepID=A0A0N5AU41_9BILA